MFTEYRGEIPAQWAVASEVDPCPRCDVGSCMLALAYLRISYDRDNDAHGVMNQRDSMVRFAEDRQATHIIFFVDNDMSGSKVRRDKAAWWLCLTAIKEQHPKYLIGVKSDRLGRRLTDIEGLDDLSRETGVKVYTLAEGDLFANPAWPFIAAMAKTEAMNTSFRVKIAQAKRREKGMDPGGGNRPYGYAIDRMTVIPEEETVIKEIAQRLIAGQTGHGIARLLNERGVPSPGGKDWKSRTIRRMMSNPRYIGMLCEELTRQKNAHEDGQWRIIGEAAWPSILEKDTWEQVQAALSKNTRKMGRPFMSLLGGIARCGYCEVPVTAGGSGNQRPTYRCAKVNGGCGRYARTRASIDEYVERHALKLLRTNANESEGVALRAEKARTVKEINDIRVRSQDLRTAYAEGRIDAENFYPTLTALQGQKRSAENAARKVLDELRILKSGQTAAARWDTMTTEERRAFLRDHLAAVLLFRTPSRGLNARVIKEGEVVLVPKNHRYSEPLADAA